RISVRVIVSSMRQAATPKPDISTWQKTGHLYLGPIRLTLVLDGVQLSLILSRGCHAGGSFSCAGGRIKQYAWTRGE
ncbi:MAG TPA: hypothetical protein VGR69_02150, partial [Candidatus Rubrimentiphilum sp.]|nr:hypothetical protein [Candidatus Rubrimentiphilum sp.]